VLHILLIQAQKFDEDSQFAEQSLRSSIPNPPANFRPREDQLTGRGIELLNMYMLMLSCSLNAYTLKILGFHTYSGVFTTNYYITYYSQSRNFLKDVLSPKYSATFFLLPVNIPKQGR
jgi:hypothetical protein